VNAASLTSQAVRIVRFLGYLALPATAFLLAADAAPSPAAELCLGASGAAENVSLDCANPPVAYANHWVGYATDGVPCQSSAGVDPCLVTSTSDYGWTISSSLTDPYENAGELGGPFATLYLWVVCAGIDALSAAGIALHGDLQVLAFTPHNGFLNAGTADELLLAVGGCPYGPLVAGEILVADPALGSGGHILTKDWSAVKALYR